jgi:hypothetical protein
MRVLANHPKSGIDQGKSRVEGLRRVTFDLFLVKPAR